MLYYRGLISELVCSAFHAPRSTLHAPGSTLHAPRSTTCAVLASLFFAAAAGSQVRGAAVPAGFTETLVATGLSGVTAMEFAPDGRLFVCEQSGALRVIKNGVLLPDPFLRLTVDSLGERGLLGVALDPAFAANGFIYVYYTVPGAPPHNRVSRFTAAGDVAAPGSEVPLMDLEPLTAVQHNGGSLHFDKDGFLYVATGENAVPTNAQSLGNRLGKILRIRSDGSIPATNPFFNVAAGENRAIWALGLRNPFTFAFQPGTGRMFINDVGAFTWEEIDDGIAGANYGWPDTEGPTADPRYRGPLYAYGHGSGPDVGCAITGGAFYNPPVSQFPPEYTGLYFYADFCGNWIRTFDPATRATAPFASGVVTPVDLDIGPDGALYYLSRSFVGGNAVYRIAAASQTPVIAVQPADQVIGIGQAATFTVQASGSAPVGYQWQRDGVDIAGATSANYTLPSATLADNGARFRVVVSNPLGTVTSRDALLSVTANLPPTGVIVTPAAGAHYRAGDTIRYSGTGSDREDGALAPSQFTWQVDFHHHDHVHPFLPPASGAASGAFTIPNTGETDADVFYRIFLTVRDSSGLTHTSFRDLLPFTSTLRLVSRPAGLTVTLDGQPVQTPAVVESVVGMQRVLGAVSPQSLGGRTYSFVSWSDRGGATHSIVTAATDRIYTASYALQPTLTLTSLTLSRPSVRGGAPVTGSVRLSGAAPAGGAVVVLSSSDSSVTAPPSVTVSAGKSTAPFTLTTTAITRTTSITVSASYAGVTRTRNLILRR